MNRIIALESPADPPPKFPETWCSHCAQAFGPGDHGFSHCENHRKFVAVHDTVVLAHRVVGRMISKTMAKRTANALNRHKPNREGV